MLLYISKLFMLIFERKLSSDDFRMALYDGKAMVIKLNNRKVVFIVGAVLVCCLVTVIIILPQNISEARPLSDSRIPAENTLTVKAEKPPSVNEKKAEANKELREKNVFAHITSSNERLRSCILTFDCFDKSKNHLTLVDFSAVDEVTELPDGFADDSGRARLLPMMGFLRCLSGDKVCYFTNDGQKLPDGAVFLSLCDKQKNPLFLYEEKICRYDKYLGFIQSSYDEKLDNRGVGLGYSFMADNHNENISLICKNDKYGYKNDETGKTIVGALYRDAYYYNEGFGIAVDNNNIIHVFDKSGDEINDISRKRYSFDCTTPYKLGYGYFYGGYTRALKDDKEVLIDTLGNEFPLPEDYSLKAYGDGIIMLEKNGNYGFMNINGEWICDPVFTYAEPFSEGLAVVGYKGGKYAMIDTNGDTVFPLFFDGISNASGGVITLYHKDLGWFVVNKLKYVNPNLD